MKERLYLVTGASGYVGSEMVRYLVAHGQRVRAMVKDPAKAESIQAPGVEVVLADLRDKASLQAAVRDVYGIHHIGSIFRQASFPEAVFFDVNAEGTRRLFDAAIEAGVQRIIHCSTGGVLGDVKNPPGNENTPYNPGDMYQRSKVEGEKIALSYFREGRIRGAVIRPAMIYGPGDTRNLKMFRMIAKRRFFYVGPCKHVHFVDVRDLARAFDLAMQHEELNGGVYHIAGEKAVPLNVAAEAIARALNVPPPSLRLPAKPLQWMGSLCEALCKPFGIEPPLHRRRVDFFTKNRHFDCSKAERELGYKPAQGFEDEVREAVTWYKEHGWL
ncbi:MAG: 3 beta-hydroxysteroid dehydrogenase/Delta 5--_4-isomerase [Verrucomicrobia bacterium ADurb.Bin345]|nr:MAG: 3 beta-hydroxysteroid dehydrogenase/Delta 5-->4-isomerase [Verrucomicrobia bacterium ADurb.Bin345]